MQNYIKINIENMFDFYLQLRISYGAENFVYLTYMFL